MIFTPGGFGSRWTQEGNAKPRVFHLPEDSAIINRYGFPSQGHAVVLGRLRSFLAAHPPSSSSSTILAVNLGKNKSSAPDSTSDFLTGVAKFGPLADVLVINVSSPNTPGLRDMQGRGMLEELLSEVVSARDKLPERSIEQWKWPKAKVVVKIAPDLTESQVQDIAEAVKSSGVDGVIVSNTTIERPPELQSSMHNTPRNPTPTDQPFSQSTPWKPEGFRALHCGHSPCKP